MSTAKSALTIVVSLMCSIPLSAQAPRQASSPTLSRDAWQRFQEGRAPERWVAVFSRATGTPKAIYGEGLRVRTSPITSQTDASDIASGVLAQHATLLGTGASTPELMIAAKVHETYVFVYRQTFRGLVVLDGRFDVRLHESGVVSMFGSEAYPVPADLAIQPGITSARAEEMATTARSSFRLDESFGAPELILWAQRTADAPRTPRLAYEVRVLEDGRPGRAYVDAHDGGLIEFRTDSHAYCTACARRSMTPTHVTGTVMGWVAVSHGPYGPPNNVPLGGLRVQIQGGGFAYTDASGHFDIPHSGTAPVNVTVTFSNARHVGLLTTGQGTPMSVAQPVTPGVPATIQVYAPTTTLPEISQATAYSLVDRVSEYVRQPHILSAHPALARLNGIVVHTNVPTLACMAHYQNNTIILSAAGTYAGMTCGNMAFSTVVEHEWGHGLDEAFGGYGDPGLAEGWADIVAQYFTEQPIIGENFLGPGQHVRDGRNTRQYPSGSSSHEQGETWMGGAWKAREYLMQSLGLLRGKQHAETIILGSIVANANTQPDAVREVFILDDDDGNLLNGTPNCRALRQAFTLVHSIPSPLTTCSRNPGVFTSYGTGCEGSGTNPNDCQSLNPNAGSPFSPALTGGVVAYGVRASQTMTVTGVALFLQGFNGRSSLVGIYRDGGGSPGLRVASEFTTPWPTHAWVETRFSTPIPVQAGEVYWIVHSAEGISASLLQSGSAPSIGTLWYAGSGAWVPIGQYGIPIDAPAWRILCSSGGETKAPTLASNDLPEIGMNFDFDLLYARANALAALLMGVSDANYGPLTLPLDLTPLGAPHCQLFTSIEASVLLSSDAQGAASLSVHVPNSIVLVGRNMFMQFAVFDPPANHLGLALSNAASLRIGTP